MKTKCGLDCEECGFKECPGCTETGGRPFGGTCMLAVCCDEKGCENCGRSFEAPCRLKEELLRSLTPWESKTWRKSQALTP